MEIISTGTSMGENLNAKLMNKATSVKGLIKHINKGFYQTTS